MAYDVNEEIVKLYLEENKFLVRTNLIYMVEKNNNIGYSDIDIIACNLRKSTKSITQANFILKTTDLTHIKFAAIEVKGWHTSNFTPSLITKYPRIFNMNSTQAQNKIKEYIGEDTEYKKILIIPSFGSNIEESSKLLEKGGFNHVILFEEILKNLIENVNVEESSSSETRQIIRLLKKYKFIESKISNQITL